MICAGQSFLGYTNGGIYADTLTAFTPNNDGVNDVFKILNVPNLTDYDLTVYNRW